jgi:hypothetical protein
LLPQASHTCTWAVSRQALRNLGIPVTKDVQARQRRTCPFHAVLASIILNQNPVVFTASLEEDIVAEHSPAEKETRLGLLT